MMGRKGEGADGRGRRSRKSNVMGGGEDRRDRKRNGGCQTARTPRGSYVEVVSHGSTNTSMVVARTAGQSQRGESTSGPIKRTYEPLGQSWTLRFLAQRP